MPKKKSFGFKLPVSYSQANPATDKVSNDEDPQPMEAEKDSDVAAPDTTAPILEAVGKGPKSFHQKKVAIKGIPQLSVGSVSVAAPMSALALFGDSIRAGVDIPSLSS